MFVLGLVTPTRPQFNESKVGEMCVMEDLHINAKFELGICDFFYFLTRYLLHFSPKKRESEDVSSVSIP